MSWWILVAPRFASVKQPPYAIGPYPSEELCRIAGHSLMPDDERFKTIEQMEAARAWKQKRNAELAKAPRSEEGYAEWGAYYARFDEHGKMLECGERIGLRFVEDIPPVALTGCVEIEDKTPSAK